MKIPVIFIQGGGDDGYREDAGLVASLRTALGGEYEVRYPRLSSDESLPDFGWPGQIGREISGVGDDAMVVAHSLGASMLLKCLSENGTGNRVRGVFLIAPPYWSGDADWVQGLKLQAGFENSLPKEVPLFFYHCRDDEEAPFAHLARYRQKLSWATFRELPDGGHQLGNDLSVVAGDIRSL